MHVLRTEWLLLYLWLTLSMSVHRHMFVFEQTAALFIHAGYRLQREIQAAFSLVCFQPSFFLLMNCILVVNKIYSLLLFSKIRSFLLCPHRRFGTKCTGCGQGISPTDLVRRARNKVFHLKCFTCFVCRKQPGTGEELYILDESRFICKDDYLASRHNQGKNFLLKLKMVVCNSVKLKTISTRTSTESRLPMNVLTNVRV